MIKFLLVVVFVIFNISYSLACTIVIDLSPRVRAFNLPVFDIRNTSDSFFDSGKIAPGNISTIINGCRDVSISILPFADLVKEPEWFQLQRSNKISR